MMAAMSSNATKAALRLGVNIDHVATLRQARGTAYPSVLEAGLLAQAAGANGITVHLREDRRHIQDADVVALLEQLSIPLNLEMAATDEMIGIACQLQPPHCCLVPEKRAELTTEGGLDVQGQRVAISAACQRLAAAGVRVSLFIDPEPVQLQAALAVGAPVVEIHTGRYADAATADEGEQELARIARFAAAAQAAGLEVHGGHGLTTVNVGCIAALPELVELNIGHSIVAEAVFTGLPAAIAAMRAAMHGARRSHSHTA